MMSRDSKDDDVHSLENGDLGLGLGLKPGSLPLLNVTNIASNSKSKKKTLDYQYPDVNGVPFIPPPTQNKFSALSKLRRRSHELSQCRDDRQEHTNSAKSLPVNMSTSNESSKLKPTISEKVEKELTEKKCKGLTKEAIARKLAEAENEVEELKAEVEVYQRRLDSKYRAIAILKQQVSEIENEFDEQEKINRGYEESLEHEVNTLNFELEKRESSLENSQEKWASRFDSMCKENACLSSLLEKRTEETRNLISRNTALSRERDELLALVDVQERSRYMKSRSVSSEEAYFDYTCTELAVLGACKCRGTSPEPCGCAHAGAKMRREILMLKEEIETSKRRRREAYLTIDAYRSAFEEQLYKNKQLLIQVAEIAVSGPSKIERAKTIIKNLIHLLNDDDYLLNVSRHPIYSVNGAKSMSQSTEESDQTMTDKDLVLALTQILHVRNEAFAHQKVAAQVLSERVQDLESQLASYQEEVFH